MLPPDAIAGLMLSDAAWSRALPRDRCNYHPRVPAAVAFAGTPLCQPCAERFARSATDPGIADGGDPDMATRRTPKCSPNR
jgi:hypothetical protein